MAVTAKWYGVPIKNQYDGTRVVDFDTDTIKTSLHTSTYTPAQDTDDHWDDATNEITGTGYTGDGVTLGSKTCTYDTSSDQIRLDAADAQWTSSSFTARIAVVYKDSGTNSTSPLIIYVDFGGDETVASGTFTIAWDSTGIGYIDVS
jgi:hypothetical protein